jgi:putative nucleotidyltransferase with HDIG domain
MSNDEPAKLKVRADPHRVMAWVDSALRRKAIQLASASLLVLVLALLLGPQLWKQDSILSRLKAGDRADWNIKATRNFDYMPTDETLRKEREAAVEKILPVFDYQADLGTIIVSRIGRAFNAMHARDTRPPQPTQVLDPKTGRIEMVPPRPKARVVAKGRIKATPTLTPQDWERRRKQFNDVLQVDLGSEDFEVLRKAHFSAELRASLLVIVGSTMNQLVISHRGSLKPYKGNPIVVRHMVGGHLGRGGEEQISNFNRIKDLQQIREEIRNQSTVHAAKLSTDPARVIVSLAQKLAVTNLSYNRGESEARRRSAEEKIRSQPISLVKGQVIIRDGDPITKDHLAMMRAMESLSAGSNMATQILGVGIFVALVLFVLFRFARKQFQRFYERPRDLVAMAVLVVGLVALAKGMVALGDGSGGQALHYSNYLIPLAAGAMLTRLLIGAEAAVLFSIVLSTFCGLLVERSLGMMVFYLVTSLVGASGVANVQSRSTILRAGLWAGLAGGALVLGMLLIQGQLDTVDALWTILGATGGPLLAAFMALALLPAMEWLFAYTTDVTLLELANLNHPLLRDLILQAPGTYHHSMVVGNLSETACESIAANGLLARVASYYHDIGKVKNAVYFAENFKPGENPHNRLKPSMSALIIRSHVKDTIEMMRETGVPELVIDTATQHHGKTLIEFFYHKAAEQKDEDEDVRDEDYRYPGPKPQSREAGVIMLADGVEAAARSLAEPSEDRLRAVVQRVINGKFTDGQLDHCDLTLRDLHLIAKSFLQVLRGIYHQRPTYPWQQEERKRESRDSRDSTKLKTVEREGDAAEERGEGRGKGKKGKDVTLKGKKKRGTSEHKTIEASNGAAKGKDLTNKGKKKRGASESKASEQEASGEPQEGGKKGREVNGKKGREANSKKGREATGKQGKKGREVNGKQGKKARATGELDSVEPRDKRLAQAHEEVAPDNAEDQAEHDGEQQAPDQPSGEGFGTEGVEPGSAQEAPSESSQDIKRLGLS